MKDDDNDVDLGKRYSIRIDSEVGVVVGLGMKGNRSLKKNLGTTDMHHLFILLFKKNVKLRLKIKYA